MPLLLQETVKRVHTLPHDPIQINNMVSSLKPGDDQHSAASLSQCASSDASQDLTHPRQIAPLPKRAQFNMDVDVQFLLHAPAMIDTEAALEEQPRKRFKRTQGHGEQTGARTAKLARHAENKKRTRHQSLTTQIRKAFLKRTRVPDINYAYPNGFAFSFEFTCTLTAFSTQVVRGIAPIAPSAQQQFALSRASGPKDAKYKEHRRANKAARSLAHGAPYRNFWHTRRSGHYKPVPREAPLFIPTDFYERIASVQMRTHLGTQVVVEEPFNGIWEQDEQMGFTSSPFMDAMPEISVPSWHPVECAVVTSLDYEAHIPHQAYFDANPVIDHVMEDVEATEHVCASDPDPAMEAATVNPVFFAPSTPVHDNLLLPGKDALAALGQELTDLVEPTYLAIASPTPIIGDLISQADDFLAVLGVELSTPVQPTSSTPSGGGFIALADSFDEFLGEELAIGAVHASTPLRRGSTSTTVGYVPHSSATDAEDLLGEIFAGSPRPATFEDMTARPRERWHTPSLDDDAFAYSPNSTVLPTPPPAGLGLLSMADLSVACDDLFAATSSTVKGERGVVTYQDVPGAFDDEDD